MKCPICEKEMENGFVQVQGTMAWVKDKHKFTSPPEKGEIFIYKYNSLSYMNLKANICKTCQNIVIDYSDSGFKEG